jgi:hypothetical protein
MVTAPLIRRRPRTHIIRDNKLEQNNISKTGVHTNSIVNAAIDDIEQKQSGSGTGTSTSSASIPWLLKKRREIRERGEDIIED